MGETKKPAPTEHPADEQDVEGHNLWIGATVMNDLARMNAACTVANEPTLSIGVEEGEEPYMLSRLAGAVRLSDGRIVLANRATDQVRWFDRDGRFLYAANRAQDTVDFQGKKVFKGGENSIVVYSIDQSTGEPTPIQHIETRAIHPRTFHIDPSGRMLVAQHNRPVDVRDGDAVRTVPAGLSVFRIGDDGKLTFVRKYDVDVAGKIMFWMGMVQL